MNELSLERYLRDAGLREALERAARRERAEYVHRLIAQAAAALLGGPRAAPAPRLRTDGCG